MTDAGGQHPEITGPRAAFRLGDWIVEPELNLIRSGQEETAVEPRVMRLLLYLAACAGRPTSKTDILASVWSGINATDESLSQAIFKLRRLLGDNPDSPTYIETIRKKGYRLLPVPEPLVEARASGVRWYVAAAVAALIVVAAIVFQTHFPRETPSENMLMGQPITSRPGRERDPAISADGRYVVYTAPGEDDSQQVYLHGVGRGTQDRLLTRYGENRAASFFAEGDRIAFLRRNGSDCSVITMTLIDGAERIIGDCAGNNYADTAVSPDGGLIAFNAVEQDGEAQAIYLMEVETGARRRLTAPPIGIWGDFDPVFSPDGRSLVFARSLSEGMQDLYVVDIDSGHERQLTDEGRNVFGVSVRGDRIVFAGNRTGRYRLWTLDYAGENRAQVPIGSTSTVNPVVSADGSTLAFEVIDRTVSLNAYDLDESAGMNQVLSFNADIMHPDTSPAGGRLSFSSNRSGYYEIWDSDLEGQGLRRLTDFRSGFTAHPKYAPDGCCIVFDARPAGVSQVFMMKADGSELRVLTGDGANAYSPTWSLDGSAIHYAAETNDGLQIMRLDLKSGENRQITLHGGLYGIEGADSYLYHVRPGTDGIWRTGSGALTLPEIVVPELGLADWGNWSIRNGTILYYDRSSGTIRSFDITTQSRNKVVNVRGTLPTADPSVAFDTSGSRAYVGIRQRLESDLEIVHWSTVGH